MKAGTREKAGKNKRAGKGQRGRDRTRRQILDRKVETGQGGRYRTGEKGMGRTECQGRERKGAIKGHCSCKGI